jgi:hypothetical protein
MTGRATSAANAVRIPGQWGGRAICTQADPDVWYPDHHALIAEAKRICAACPVQAECLDYRCLEPTHGAASRPASGAAPSRANAPGSGTHERR